MVNKCRVWQLILDNIVRQKVYNKACGVKQLSTLISGDKNVEFVT